MILRVIDHKFHYEMENLCRVFYPYESIRVLQGDEEGEDPLTVVTLLGETDSGYHISVTFNGEGKSCEETDFTDCEREMAVLLFDLLCDATGYVPQWGILTGVRPSKLMNTLISQMGEENAVSYFNEKLLVSPQKTALALSVAKAEERIMSLSDEKSFSLYISIPFCPTRCNYCSFVSHSIAQAKKLLPEYVKKLCEEIRVTAEIAKSLGLRLESVYWGGGTPTTLSAEQLEEICCEIENNFDLSRCREYTIEAGRADTVTPEKLDVIRKHAVTRISVNPQTFNDDVLLSIGRRHTVADVLDVYSTARGKGFDNINMDLIAGLTDDSYESFCRSVDKAVELSPENITLHTLALKRSSAIVTGGIDVESGEIANRMLEYASEKFYGAGYVPYYMYRQSRSLGNLENVGWCKEGFECLYNIFMMEECHTILGVGAGAVIKLKEPFGRNIERVFNYKYPYEYISRFDTILERKAQITDFYNKINCEKH
ncbi:MAG: coproporphyrinogen dehydrogenase HemZ [Clostridia bacterium]|nr:coproporphyrinogen dehydrogenase HemZ [Clostridia bacterium]